MSQFQDREAAVRFPFCAADNTGMTGNQRIACTGAAQTFAIPAAARNKFVYFRAIGVEVQASAAGSAQTLVLDQVSSAAAASSSAACAPTLFAGEFWDRALVDGETHLCWISRTATGYVESFISEAKYT